LSAKFGKKSERTSLFIKEPNTFNGCFFEKKVRVRCSQEDDDSSDGKILFYNDLFESCSFKEAVVVEGPKKYLDSMSAPQLKRSALVERHEVQNLFTRCEFQKSLKLSKLIFFTPISSFMEGKRPKSLEIDSCIFDAEFKLNNLKEFDLIQIKNSEFHEKFEFKESCVDFFEVENTNFKKIADFFKSKFKSFNIEKSIFEDFAAFENCVFKECQKTATVFRYVTFKNFSNFRSSEFNSGLDIEKSNFAQPPNFLDAKIDFDNTPRETFRLIKHSFDSAGNYIEANRFFADEMKKYRKDLSKKSKGLSKKGEKVFEKVRILSVRLLLTLNDWVSRFGQSYIRPIAFFMATILLFQGYSYLHDIDWLISNLPKVNEALLPITNFVNSFAQFVMPFNKLLVTDMEFASLIFTVLSSVFLWHLIIAVKRQVKR
jgi:hypothetical protein